MKLKRELYIRRAKNGFVLKVDLEQVIIYTEKDELLKDLAGILGPPEMPARIAPYLLTPAERESLERLQPEEPV